MKKEDILKEIKSTVRRGVKMIEEKENKSSCVIDMEKLGKYAEGISLLDIDYGITYVNEEQNKICISLGDSNPFDMEMLENQIPYEVTKGYKEAEKISIEIDCEFVPSEIREGEGKWKMWKNGIWKKC